jgi:hypothetical protein
VWKMKVCVQRVGLDVVGCEFMVMVRLKMKVVGLEM